MEGTVAVIDYGSGNLRSVAKALERAAGDAGLTARIVVTAEAATVARAARIVLPGVGAFGDCAAGLAAIPGLPAALEQAVRGRGVPFLGICVGMQLMATRGLEHGEHRGLDWIPGTVARLAPADPALKVPHMGWNALAFRRGHAVCPPSPSGGGPERGDISLRGESPPQGETHAPHAYFVHSYAMTPDDPADVLATADYGGPVTAMVARGNLLGTQFHPEKSQAFGLALLARFLAWRP